MAHARPSAAARQPRHASRGLPSMTARQLAAYWEARDVLRRLKGAAARPPLPGRGAATSGAPGDAPSSRP